MKAVNRRRTVVDNRALALSIGERIREARLAAGLTQRQLAEGRYTKAYISALEKGHAKPSMAALDFLAGRLGQSPAHFLGGDGPRWSRLEADLLLASGRWGDALDAYLSLPLPAADRAARAEIQRGMAEALCRLGRGMEAIGPASEAAELFRQLNREPDAVLADYWLANALYLTENIAEARSLLRGALNQVRSGRLQVEPDLRMRLITAMASIETWEGEHAVAVSLLEEARVFSAELDDRRRAAFLSTLAQAYHGSGDMEGAIRAGTESLALFRAAEAERETALVHNDLANAYVRVGNLERARAFASEARTALVGLGDAHELAHVLDTEARIELAGGGAQTAIHLARRAISAARSFDNRKAMADGLVTMARAAVGAGDRELALESYQKAAQLLRETGPRARLQRVLAEWAELLAELGQHDRAYELTREALRGPGGAPAA